jgi:hypothetical protein
LFNIDVIEASAECGAAPLREGDDVTRPGGNVALNSDVLPGGSASLAWDSKDHQDSDRLTTYSEEPPR